MVGSQRLDQRQWIVLFIAGVTLCFVFFLLGLFVGKWTAGSSASASLGASPSARPGFPPRSTSPSPVPSKQLAPRQAEGTTSRSSSLKGESPKASVGAPAKRELAPSVARPAPPSAPPASSSPQRSAGSPASTTAPSSPGESPLERTYQLPTTYFVQAGAFDDADQAEELAATLRSREYLSAHTKVQTLDSGEKRYLVLLGPYVDRDSAARTLSELRNEGVSGVKIVTRP